MTRAPIEETQNVIDTVHKDGVLPPIPVAIGLMEEGALGRFAWAKDFQPLEIRIDPGTLRFATRSFTVMHEVGHFLDFSGIGQRGWFASDSDDPWMTGWRRSVD